MPARDVAWRLRALFVLFGQQSGFVVTWAVLTQRIFERVFPNSFCSPYSVCRQDVSNSCLGGYTAPVEVKPEGKTWGYWVPGGTASFEMAPVSKGGRWVSGPP